MKFKRADKSVEDYKRRQRAYFKFLRSKNLPQVEVNRLMSDWIDENTPYEPHEREHNLLRALGLKK